MVYATYYTIPETVFWILKGQKDLFAYDIALIQLPKPFKSSHKGSLVRPICFLNRGLLAETEQLTIIGMGMTKSSRKMKEGALKLQEAHVKVISAKKCYGEHKGGLTIPRSFDRIKHKGICVKGAKKETACMNDSGSGAFGFNEGGSAFLIGVAFYGGAKCRKELMLSGKGLPKKSVRPTIYIPIAGKIYEWIKNHDRFLHLQAYSCTLT